MVSKETVWGYVGGGNEIIWIYQQSWNGKLATVTIIKADVSSVSPSSERRTTKGDEGLTLETSAFIIVTVANLPFQLCWYIQIIM